MDTAYNSAFFDHMDAMARASAREIVPMVIDLVHPASVVDVGCGNGVWLAAFRERGVTDALGVDGPWVDRSRLSIPAADFLAADLTKPLDLPRRFDLAVSLEVAEHLPAEAAAGFVNTLAGLSEAVLFSAAVPYQGGTSHLNEQWPAYWAAHFARHGYRAVDALRLRVWNNPKVAWYYRQNVLIYASPAALERHPGLRAACADGADAPRSLVHPDRYEVLARASRKPSIDALSLPEALGAVPKLARRAIGTRVRRLLRRGRPGE